MNKLLSVFINSNIINKNIINNIYNYILLLLDYVSNIPLIIYGSYFYQFVITHNFMYLYFCIYLFCCDIIVKCIKRLPYPNILYKFTRRPNGATKCDYLSRDTKYNSNSPGFPSGHMVSITIFSMYKIIEHIWNHEVYEHKLIGSYILFHIWLIFIMGIARYYKKCHTLPQIIFGILFGIIGSLYWFIYFIP